MPLLPPYPVRNRRRCSLARRNPAIEVVALLQSTVALGHLASTCLVKRRGYRVRYNKVVYMYHEGILVARKHALEAVASGYATRSSLCGASTALIELWARIQASVPRPHSLPWTRLARSIYESCLAGACFASRFLPIVGCNIGGAQPSQKQTKREGQRQRQRISRERRYHAAADNRSSESSSAVLWAQNPKCRLFSSDYALHVRSGLVMCANI